MSGTASQSHHRRRAIVDRLLYTSIKPGPGSLTQLALDRKLRIQGTEIGNHLLFNQAPSA